MRPTKLHRRRFLQYGAACSIGSLGYARFVEPHWLQTNHLVMDIPNLPPFWHGKKVIHATDLHISPIVDDEYVCGVFRTIDSHQPDLVLYTGDFVSSDSELKGHVPEILKFMSRGTVGTYANLGNHDYGPHFDDENYAAEVVALLMSQKVHVLRNEHAEVDGLTIIGVDDLWAERCQPRVALAGVRPGTPSIALLHNPDGVELEEWDGFSNWILSGHTHGGQCRLPFLPPPRLPIHHRKYASGLFSLSGGRTLYVNRGVGHSLPVRFCARPEICVFELRDKG